MDYLLGHTHRAGELIPIPPTGKQVIVTRCTVSHVVKGKVVEDWEYADWLGLLQQLGPLKVKEVEISSQKREKMKERARSPLEEEDETIARRLHDLLLGVWASDTKRRKEEIRETGRQLDSKGGEDLML